jgi:hypothetical protein
MMLSSGDGCNQEQRDTNLINTGSLKDQDFFTSPKDGIG